MQAIFSALFLALFTSLSQANPTDPNEPIKGEAPSGTVLIIFGQRLPDGSLKRTREIEWKPDNKYGWDITVISKKPELKLKEILTLPTPAEWKLDDTKPTGTLSRKSELSKTSNELIRETVLNTTEPALYKQTFKILPADPKGEHRVRIYLNGILASDIIFILK